LPVFFGSVQVNVLTCSIQIGHELFGEADIVSVPNYITCYVNLNRGATRIQFAPQMSGRVVIAISDTASIPSRFCQFVF
jgi:hypothetical protein